MTVLEQSALEALQRMAKTMEKLEKLEKSKIDPMTQRDKFAMAALSAIGGASLEALDVDKSKVEQTAVVAYKLADAMMKAR